MKPNTLINIAFLIIALGLSLACVACAPHRELIRIEKGDFLRTETKVLEQPLRNECSLKINQQKSSNIVNIKVTNDMYQKKEEEDIYKQIGIYKVYDTLSKSQKVNLAYQTTDLLIRRPLIGIGSFLVLRPLWEPKDFYKSLFRTPPGYKSSTHEEKECLKETTGNDRRISPEEVCTPKPIENKEVSIRFQQDNNQTSKIVNTSPEGNVEDVRIDLPTLPWLHRKAALDIEASISCNNQTVRSDLRIDPDELAGLGFPEKIMPEEEPGCPSSQAIENYVEGRKYYDGGYNKKDKLQKAIDEFNNAIKKYSNFPNAHTYLGLAYNRIKTFKKENYVEDVFKAMFHLEESLRLDPDQTGADDLRKIIDDLNHIHFFIFLCLNI